MVRRESQRIRPDCCGKESASVKLERAACNGGLLHLHRTEWFTFAGSLFVFLLSRNLMRLRLRNPARTVKIVFGNCSY